MIQIRPIQSFEIEQVTKLGEKDNHGIIAPTHVVEDNHNFVGCLSVGSIPLVLTWLDTNSMKALGSSRVFQQIEQSLRFNGCRVMAYSCPVQSPFYKFAERAGYTKVVDNGALLMKVL